MCTPISRREFLKASAAASAGLIVPAMSRAQATRPAATRPVSDVRGKRVLTVNSVIRVNQIEVTRDKNAGFDENDRHTPANVRALRDAFAKGWPGGRMTWALSWHALQDQRPNYREIRRMVRGYHEQYGDDVTFIPGGFFANAYNDRVQVSRDLHDALQMVGDVVGNRYRPASVVAGFLAADNLRYLAEQEDIHVCQGNIWSQYAIDNQDGDGSICYPYFPSREHFCKPAQGPADFIDCVNLDGWTCDFLAARREGFKDGFNSRMGVGPIETIGAFGPEKGLKQMLATTAVHFDEGFRLNGFGWVTNCWEISLVPQVGHLETLTAWLDGIRQRWPEAICPTQGELGLAWRGTLPPPYSGEGRGGGEGKGASPPVGPSLQRWGSELKGRTGNDGLNYRFVQRGTGIGGSDANLEIRWFMNKWFRLATLRDWKADSPERVIDFTRYDLPAREPADQTRRWSLMGRINQKGTRPQDKPVAPSELPEEDRKLIASRYPELAEMFR